MSGGGHICNEGIVRSVKPGMNILGSVEIVQVYLIENVEGETCLSGVSKRVTYNKKWLIGRRDKAAQQLQLRLRGRSVVGQIVGC